MLHCFTHVLHSATSAVLKQRAAHSLGWVPIDQKAGEVSVCTPGLSFVETSWATFETTKTYQEFFNSAMSFGLQQLIRITLMSSDVSRPGGSQSWLQ